MGAIRESASALAGTIGVAALGGLAYAALVEPKLFKLQRYTLPILRQREQITVLHIADLHMVPGQRRKIEWVRQLAELEPDFVINTGDNLGHRHGLGPALQALEPLLDIPGVFVPGSNDYYAPRLKNPARYLWGPSKLDDDLELLPTEDLHRHFSNAGWLDLTNRVGSLVLPAGELAFVGVDDPHIEREDLSTLHIGGAWDSLIARSDPIAAIGLTHAPYSRVLDGYTRSGVDAIFSGHTHGGQLRIPGYGALVSNSDLPPSQARGVSSWEAGQEKTFLHVSAGLGTSPFAAVRFACRPEAALITLTARQG